MEAQIRVHPVAASRVQVAREGVISIGHQPSLKLRLAKQGTGPEINSNLLLRQYIFFYFLYLEILSEHSRGDNYYYCHSDGASG